MAYEIVRFPYDGTVDADGHLLEPAGLWEEYLEERYRDRALRIRPSLSKTQVLEWLLLLRSYRFDEATRLGERVGEPCHP